MGGVVWAVWYGSWWYGWCGMGGLSGGGMGGVVWELCDVVWELCDVVWEIREKRVMQCGLIKVEVILVE